MRLTQTIFFLLTFFTLGQSLALPRSLNGLTEASKQLFKRKGGGGGGGRSGGGRSGGSSSSSTSSSGGSRGGGGGGGGSSSSTGGGRTPSTSSGTGATRGFGGGRFYGGGATSPYSSGSARSGLRTPVLVGAGALVLFPALALAGAYSYAYPYYWNYRNNTSGMNESVPAECWCARGAQCGCDQNNDTEYINSVANNATVAKLARLPGNDSDTLVVDGTLPNDTTVSGTMTDQSGAVRITEMMGYWPMLAAAIATAYIL